MQMLQLVLALTLAAAGCASASAVGPTLIQTSSGPVLGASSSIARYWKGIPYAAPPVGQQRWANPVAPASWTSPRKTQSFGPACPQDCQLPPAACQAQISEDCLYLNVYAPLQTSSLLPVLVFFHGGRYEQGSEGVELYDGSNIANISSTIVVTVNYRLGVLGFLTLPNGFTGNYGLRDQRLALQWVQANIAAFGGDRTLVTIFGQSAGATSVSAHLVSPLSYNLFKRVIIESSPYSLPLLDSKSAAGHYEVFAATAGCVGGATGCLRNLTWQQVVTAEVKAQNTIYLERPLVLFFPWTPVIDGEELPSDPLTMMDRGQISPSVDAVILGTVSEEARMFVYDGFSSLNEAETIALIGAIFRGKHEVQDILQLYPLPKNVTDYRDYMSVIASDFIMICSGRNVSNALTNRVPFYLYQFNHAWSVKGAWGPQYPFCDGHVCHGAELPFVFNSAGFVGYNFTAAEVALAQLMSNIWGTFARTGSPNVAGLPMWPQHDPNSDATMIFQTNGSYVTSRLRAEYCNFWDKEGYIF